MSWKEDPLSGHILRLLARSTSGLSFTRIDLLLSSVRKAGDSIPYAVLRGLKEEGYVEVTTDNGVFAITESGLSLLDQSTTEVGYLSLPR